MIKIVLAIVLFISCNFVHCGSDDSEDFETLPPKMSHSKPPIARPLNLNTRTAEDVDSFHDPFESAAESSIHNTSFSTIVEEEPIKRKPVILKCVSPHTNLVFGVTAYESNTADIEMVMVNAFKTEYFCGLLKYINACIFCGNGLSYFRILDEKAHSLMKEQYEEWLNEGFQLKAALLKWDYMRFFGMKNLKERAWKAF